MSKIDLRFNQHDLRAIIDKQDYPAMKRKGSLRVHQTDDGQGDGEERIQRGR